MRRERQALLIDADDTLWENNLRFEQALEAFLELAAPLGYAHDTIRRQVDATERRNIRRRGYGARSFLLSLEEVYLKLAGPRAQPAVARQVRALAALLLEEPPRLFEAVPETLAYLRGRHRLVLVTKGEAEEQTRKVADSGLAAFFGACEVLGEKDATAYRGVLKRHRLKPRESWMVGNSPRSDINPALAAGLNAVFIPSAHNWEHEQATIRGGRGTLLVLARFRDLQEHF